MERMLRDDVGGDRRTPSPREPIERRHTGQAANEARGRHNGPMAIFAGIQFVGTNRLIDGSNRDNRLFVSMLEEMSGRIAWHPVGQALAQSADFRQLGPRYPPAGDCRS